MEKRYSGRRRRHLRWLWLLMIPVLAAGYTLWRFGPQRSYTARQLGLTDLQSPNDADGDGVDDWRDVVLGARTVVEAVKYSKQVAEEMDEYLTKRREK